MCPSYVRIRLPLGTALDRFTTWIGLPELEPPHRTKERDAVDRACQHGVWRGVALFVHEANGWTVFDDLTGYLASVPRDRWRDLAGGDDLVFAGYNDAVPYGQLIVVRNTQVIREFLDDCQKPRHNVNRGRLDIERDSPIDDWIAAASFVDEDQQADAGAEQGLLLLYRKAR